jgi:hypothetical protein
MFVWLLKDTWQLSLSEAPASLAASGKATAQSQLDKGQRKYVPTKAEGHWAPDYGAGMARKVSFSKREAMRP